MPTRTRRWSKINRTMLGREDLAPWEVGLEPVTPRCQSGVDSVSDLRLYANTTSDRLRALQLSAAPDAVQRSRTCTHAPVLLQSHQVEADKADESPHLVGVPGILVKQPADRCLVTIANCCSRNAGRMQLRQRLQSLSKPRTPITRSTTDQRHERAPHQQDQHSRRRKRSAVTLACRARHVRGRSGRCQNIDQLRDNSPCHAR